MKRCLARGLLFYSRYLSPFLPPHCRFYPSCSHYAREAIEQHGIMRGTRLALCRIAKCQPWHAGGFDPVPPKSAARNTALAVPCTHESASVPLPPARHSQPTSRP